jgi:hypothetical protein
MLHHPCGHYDVIQCHAIVGHNTKEHKGDPLDAALLVLQFLTSGIVFHPLKTILNGDKIYHCQFNTNCTVSKQISYINWTKRKRARRRRRKRRWWWWWEKPAGYSWLRNETLTTYSMSVAMGSSGFEIHGFSKLSILRCAHACR